MSTIISDMVSHLQCGVSIALNDAVYINSADGKIYKYDPLQPLQVYAGIAKEAGLLNAFIRVVQSGRVKGFSGLTAGAFVYASVTVPGGFQLTDPGSSLKVVLGIAKSATELTVNGALGIKTGGGTGSGGINYILNPDADTTVGWATYADAGGVTPVDGTGGSPTVTLTRSTSSPLRGTASFLYTKPASNVQGQGFSYDFTIDNADCGKVLQGSFDYQIASGTFVDDAMTVWIYDITNSRLIQPAPTKLKNSGIIERFPFEFQTSIDSVSYRLIVHQSSAVTTVCTIKFDNFKVGPTAKAYGSAVTDWATLTTPPPITGSGGGTLSIGTGGGAEYSVQYKKIGDEVLLKYKLRIGTSGAVDVTGAWIFNFPSNMPALVGGFEALGYGDITVLASANPVARLIPKAYSTGFLVDVNDTANLATGSLAFNNNNVLSITVRYKVAGWSSSQIMSSDADTRVVQAQVTNGSGATQSIPAITHTKIAFNTIVEDSHGAFNISNNRYSFLVQGTYSIHGSVFFTAPASVGKNSILLYINGGPVRDTENYAPTGQDTAVPYSFQITVKSGDYVELFARVAVANTIQTAAARYGGSTLNISRISGPSQIAASESVSCLYTGAPPTGTLGASFNVVKFGTKVKDSHGAYNPATGEYIVPVSGVYSFAGFITTAGTYAVNQQLALSVGIGADLDSYLGVTTGNEISVGCASINVHSVPLLQGTIVRFGSRSDGTSPVYAGSANLNYMSITRTGNY